MTGRERGGPIPDYAPDMNSGTMTECKRKCEFRQMNSKIIESNLANSDIPLPHGLAPSETMV